MDLHSLTRKELQLLCKNNKIPANMTNVAMADALKALEIVEGLEECLKSSESPEKKAITSPSVPRTGCRASTRRKPIKDETETIQIVTTTRRGTRRRIAGEEEAENDVPETPAGTNSHRRAPAASTRRKMETQLKECEEEDQKIGAHVDKKKKDVPESPVSVSSSRRRGTAAAIRQKDESVVQRVYSTRQSSRLSEKKLVEPNLNLKKKEKTEPIKIDSFSNVMSENLEAKSKEGLNDFDEVSGTTDMTSDNDLQTISDESLERTDDSEVISSQKSEVILDNDKDLKHDVQEKRDDDFEVDDQKAKSGEVSDTLYDSDAVLVPDECFSRLKIESNSDVEDELCDPNDEGDDDSNTKSEVGHQLCDESNIILGKKLELKNEALENKDAKNSNEEAELDENLYMSLENLCDVDVKVGVPEKGSNGFAVDLFPSGAEDPKETGEQLNDVIYMHLEDLQDVDVKNEVLENMGFIDYALENPNGILKSAFGDDSVNVISSEEPVDIGVLDSENSVISELCVLSLSASAAVHDQKQDIKDLSNLKGEELVISSAEDQHAINCNGELYAIQDLELGLASEEGSNDTVFTDAASSFEVQDEFRLVAKEKFNVQISTDDSEIYPALSENLTYKQQLESERQPKSSEIFECEEYKEDADISENELDSENPITEDESMLAAKEKLNAQISSEDSEIDPALCEDLICLKQLDSETEPESSEIFERKEYKEDADLSENKLTSENPISEDESRLAAAKEIDSALPEEMQLESEREPKCFEIFERKEYKENELDSENPLTEESNAEVIPSPKHLTPMKKSLSKTTTMKRMTQVSDNKENIDKIGKKMVLIKEKGKEKKKDNVGDDKSQLLNDLSVRQLTKMLKEKLQITNNMNNNEENNIATVMKTRPALQALSENQPRVGGKPDKEN